MAVRFPTIQSFFGPAAPTHVNQITPETCYKGDGFTSDEVDAVLRPSVNMPWTPAQPYDEFDIASLALGPRRVVFRGRIANLYNQVNLSKKPRAAKGCFKLVVKDDTGALTVSLYSFHEQAAVLKLN